MKVLVVRPGPHFSVLDVHRGWVKGLNDCGANVVDFNFDDQMEFYASAEMPHARGAPQFTVEQAAMLASKGVEAACYEFNPDVVVVISGFFLPPALYDLIRSRGTKIVLVHTESPYEDDKQVARAQYADLNVLNDPTNIDRFPPGTIYLGHCFDPSVHYRRTPIADAASDFVFVGTGYQSRIDFLEQVCWDNIDVALAGQWRQLEKDSGLRKFLAHDILECCDNAQAVELYSSAKVAANLYRKEGTESDGWAVGPREIELAACRTFFLREPRGEGDELFPMLPTFDSPGDFEEKLRWWLAHDNQRKDAAFAAQQAVQGRTFQNIAAKMLHHLCA